MKYDMDFIKLFDEARPIKNLNLANVTLPVDKGGVDIFRSTDIEWKLESSFTTYFFKLVDIISHYIESSNNQIANEYNYEFSGIHFPESIELKGYKIPKAFDLDNCTFEGDLVIDDCHFRRGLSLSSSNFKGIVSFKNSIIRSLISTTATFHKTLRITDCDFEYEITFFKSKFHRLIVCQRAVFDGTLDFSKCIINISDNLGFTEFFDTVFYDVAFQSTDFHCGIAFNNIKFRANVEFIDTSFSNTQDLDFNNIQVDKGGMLVFMSTDDTKKIFRYRTRFAIREKQIGGKIYFKNADLNKLDAKDKEQFIRLSKSTDEKVVIEKGCLKYRHTTDDIIIRTGSLCRKLIEDMANTFINFFTIHSRYNLGFQIEEKSDSLIRYFYFTDENITEDEFYSYLRYNEDNIWRIVKNEPVQSNTGNYVTTTDKDGLYIHFTKVEIAALFHKMSAGLLTKTLDDNEANNVLSAIHFNENWNAIQPKDVINLLLTNFTDKVLEKQFNPTINMKLNIKNFNNSGTFIAADTATIVQSSPFLTNDDNQAIDFVKQHGQSDEQKVALITAMERLKDGGSSDVEKKKARELWRKFLESGVGEIAKEGIKGLFSPTFWALIMS